MSHDCSHLPKVIWNIYVPSREIFGTYWMDNYYLYESMKYLKYVGSSYITIMILVVNVKFIWKNEIFYFIPYVPFKIIGGQISHTWVMFPHLGIHIQSFTHLLVLNYNFLTLRVCLLLISQQTFLYGNIFILYNV